MFLRFWCIFLILSVSSIIGRDNPFLSCTITQSQSCFLGSVPGVACHCTGGSDYRLCCIFRLLGVLGVMVHNCSPVCSDTTVRIVIASITVCPYTTSCCVLGHQSYGTVLRHLTVLFVWYFVGAYNNSGFSAQPTVLCVHMHLSWVLRRTYQCFVLVLD